MNEIDIYNRIDELLNSLNSSDRNKKRLVRTNPTDNHVMPYIVDYKLINYAGSDTWASTGTISEKGIEVLNSGGFVIWLASQKEKTQNEESLEQEKLKYEVKNAKRIYNTYWITFLMAAIGFLFAVYSFFYALFSK